MSTIRNLQVRPGRPGSVLMWIDPRRSRCTASAQLRGCWTRRRPGYGRGRSATGWSSPRGARVATACTRATRSINCATCRTWWTRDCTPRRRTGYWRCASPRGPASSRRLAHAALTPVLILLAERDLYAAELIEYFLRTEGHEVVIALDAADAVSICTSRHPDIVFVELVMSGGVGLELCRELSALGAHRRGRVRAWPSGPTRSMPAPRCSCSSRSIPSRCSPP